MKSCMSVLLFIFLVVVTLAVSIVNLDSQWEEFKKTYNRTYASPEEEALRKEIFTQNLLEIQEHNEKFAKGEVSYEQGVNDFADITDEEFLSGVWFKPNGEGF
ncbi:hypothetical protein HHI36_018725 [Cryptolaemus montrouzieri]|uniref:Cathepsin propeptide inhibitor domain-containing protein n=1 Tax=Cryptolaemus montrouzieri TaxID=559131 RepID=A0ABD2P0U7_9CUCU